MMRGMREVEAKLDHGLRRRVVPYLRVIVPLRIVVPSWTAVVVVVVFVVVVVVVVVVVPCCWC